MKNLFLCISLLMLAFINVHGQETFTYDNIDKNFFEGKELFSQRKFAASLVYFNRFLEQKKVADSEKIQEAHYYIACEAYEMRRENAATLLGNYLQNYPYTQFKDKVYLMLGNLSFQKKKYKKALVFYDNVTDRRLSDEEAAELNFNQGYSYLAIEDYSKAMSYFKQLRGKKSKYANSAAYYYSYCQYSQKNYDAALEGFLAIKDQAEFSAFVPYYIIQIYYYKKDYDNLIPYAEKVLSENPSAPNNVEVNRILGEIAYQRNDYQKTIEYLKAYAKGNPKVMRNDMYILGMSYFNVFDFKNAANSLTKVTSVKDSLSQNAYLHLGHSYVQLENKNNARMSYRTASEMDFDKKVKEEAAYNYILTTFETTTPFGESIKAFEAFLNEFPDSEYKQRVTENLITAYMSSKNFNAARESLDNFKALSPAMKDVKAYILFQLGTEEFVKAYYDNAIQDFNNSLELATPDFNDAQVYYWRAESHYRNEDYELARKDYQTFFSKKGANLFPEYNLANYAIAYTYFQNKQYKESLPSFKDYVKGETNKKAPTYSDALDRIADVYFMGRNFNEAEKYYDLSIQTGSRSGDYAAYQKALVLGLLKNYNGKVTGMKELQTKYPKSDYQDDSYYEMGRAYVLLEKREKALEAYRTLIEKFPLSPLARKAALEIGMLYYNAGDYDKAIEAYKKVVAAYPNSEETRTALETLEAIYVEKNAVSEYFDYTKSKGLEVADANKEDSLTYLAAERLYMKSNIISATDAFENYLTNFCPGGRSCINARFYLADCYYSTSKMLKAMEQYKTLSELAGNPFMETVLVRLSQISYDQKDYETALVSFKQLQQVAQEKENINAAKIGVLRCSYLLNDAETTVGIATDIISNEELNEQLDLEARYYLAKAYIQKGEKAKAQPELAVVAKDLRTESGAESKYLMADYEFISGNDKKAEEIISDFIAKGTPHQYWLARAFVLLSDIYIYRKDDFQAKQYLLSLQANYPNKDSILDLVQERLDGIQERENNTIIE